jgi:glycosyltransferase involved in cell wall biosynthesis
MLFGAADAVVLPYRSGTQSGITAIAQHFAVPVLATDVGGLKEAIAHEATGLVIPAPEAAAVRDAIARLFEADRLPRFRKALLDRRAEHSWERFAQGLVDFCEVVRHDRVTT